jgi:tetratricopeptide (TPR) repeat protein
MEAGIMQAPAITIAMILLIALSGQIRSEEFTGCRGMLDSGDVSYGEFNNGLALDWYRRAFEQCPDSYEALMKMTRAYIDMGQSVGVFKPESLFMTGLRFADSLRTRYPDSSQGYFLTSVAAGSLCLIRKGARKVMLVRIVERNARKAIELAPDFAPAYVVLGIYYREIAVANPILKFFALFLLGRIPDGTLKDSETALQQALRLSPDYIFALLELARTDLLMSKKNEAIENLKRAQTLKSVWYMDDRLKQECGRVLKSLGS